MTIHRGKVVMLLLLSALCTAAFGQKIQIGYDKGVDFSKFTSYTLAEPTTPPTRPLLYASIVGSIDHQLTSKGLANTNDGDLIVVPTGGVDFGLNTAAGTPIISTYRGSPPTIDASMWVGAAGFSNLMAPYVPEGTLILTFVDRRAAT